METLEDRSLLSFSPIGAEFIPFTISSSSDSSVAMNSDGRHVITQVDSSEIRAQFYDPSGAPIGSVIEVNPAAPGIAVSSKAIAMPNGDFLFVFVEKQSGAVDEEIYVRRYSETGNALTPVIHVNTFTTGVQYKPSAAVDAAGNFVIVWESYGQDGSAHGVFGQRFDATGAPVGSEFQVNTTTIGNQQGASVAVDAGGNFVVVWADERTGYTNRRGYGRRYDASGNALSGEFLISTDTLERYHSPAIGMSAAGSFVVAWENYASSTVKNARARHFDAAGTAIGSEFSVSPTANDEQLAPTLFMLSTGDYFIAWNDDDEEAIRAQKFDASGARVGADFRISTSNPLTTTAIALAGNDAGDLIAAWKISNSEVRVQRFGDVAGNTIPTADAGGPYTFVHESNSGSVALAGAGFDPDANQQGLLTYRWDLNDDGVFADASGGSVNVTWSMLAGLGINTTGERTIRLRVTDTAGAESTSTATLTITPNTPPVAVAGGPYTVNAGNSLQLDATGSFDPDLFPLASFRWDLNGDGNFGEITGQSPIVSWSQLVNFGFVGGDSKPIRVQVRDSSGVRTDSDPVLVTVIPNTPPVASAGGPYTLYYGVYVIIDARASFDIDPGQTASLSYSWDMNNDGVFGDITGDERIVSWSQLETWGLTTVGMHTIRVSVTDSAGGVSIAEAAAEARPNFLPTGTVAGPYVVAEGESVELSATYSDPDIGQNLSHAWDIDDDGQFDDAVGSSPLVTWSTLVSRGINDGGMTRNIRVRVSDGQGGVVISDPVLLTVVNAAPTASLEGANWVVAGETYSYTLHANDPSPIDQAATFTYLIDWDGDGIDDETMTGSAATPVTHGFATPGQFTIRVRAIDKDGGVGAAGNFAVQVNPIADSTNGPLLIEEGESLAYYAYSTIDTGVGSTVYSWDLNDNGVFGDALGASGSFSWSALTALGLDDGDATWNVSVQATNATTNESRLIHTTLTILSAAPTLNAVAYQPGVVGQTLTFELSATDPSEPDELAGFTYLLDWNNDGIDDQSLFGIGPVEVEHMFSAVGHYSVRVTSIDRDGRSSIGSFYTNINMGDYVLYEGDSLDLPESMGDLGPNTWEIKNFEGDELLETSGALHLDWEELQGFVGGDGPWAFTATTTVWIYGGLGQYYPSGGTYTVTLLNRAPTADIGVPDLGLRPGGQAGNVVRGQVASFTLLAADPSWLDQQAGYTFHVDWNGDGTNDETFVGMSGMQVQHTFAQSGNYAVRVTATDKDAGTSSIHEATVKVVDWDLRPDPNDSSKTDLHWGGTNGIDAYGFVPGGFVFIQAQNNQFFFTPQVVMTGGFNGKLYVYAQGSNDLLFADVMNQSVVFYGGDGDDVLVGGRGGDHIDGGNGNDILLGGTLSTDGSDTIYGGAGNDLIVGHYGADRLSGEAGEDLVMAGTLFFDSLPNAVYAIQAEWLSGRSYAERVGNLSGTGVGPRNNGSYFLTPTVSALDDGAIDEVLGGADQDWLLADLETDLHPDFAGDEMETDLV